MIEVRGVGIVGLAHEPAAVVRLVVDCAAGAPARMPEAADAVEIVAGIAIPRLVSPADERNSQSACSGACTGFATPE